MSLTSVDLYESQDSSQEKVIEYLTLLIHRSKFNSAIEYITKIHPPSIKIAEKWDLQVIEAFVRLMIYQGYHNKVLNVVDQALIRASEIDSNKLLLSFNYWRGIIALALKQSSYSYLFKAYNLGKDLIDYPLYQSQALLGFSMLPEAIGHREEILLKSLYVLQDHQKNEFAFSYQKAHVMNSLGIFYGLLQNYESSSFYFNQAITLAKSNDDKRRLAGSLINYANLNFLMNQNDPEILLIGRGMLKEAIKILEDIECLDYLALAHKSLADYYYSKDRKQEALAHITSVATIELKRDVLSELQLKEAVKLLSTFRKLK